MIASYIIVSRVNIITLSAKANIYPEANNAFKYKYDEDNMSEGVRCRQ